MPVRNLGGITISAWVPPWCSANYKVEISKTVDGATVTYDITDILMALRITNEATTGIGSFEFTIPNADESYSGAWTGMETFNFYCDYADTPTTIRFKGYVEKVSYVNNAVRVSGRSNALFLMDASVTRRYSNQDVAVTVVAILPSQYTSTNVPGIAGVSLASTVFAQKPGMTCVKELCDASGYEFYIDPSDDAHFFESGSVTNTSEGIVHDYNLIDVGDFAEDIQQVKNKIVVYGAVVDGVQVIYTLNDFASQATYGVRPLVVNEQSIINELQAKQYAEYLLARNKDPPVVGEVKSLMLATIAPGDKIWMSSPANSLPPALYKTTQYTHEINDEGIYTTVVIEKEPTKFTQVMKERIETEYARQNTVDNLYDMDFSYGFTFDDDLGSHSTTQIVSGVLKSTSSSGTWVSPVKSLEANISQGELIVNGQTLTGATFYVSGDGGINYEQVTAGELKTFSSAIGDSLVIKVVFSDATTQVESLNLLYKTV